ncbi:hypothetical protein EV182_004494, partial [Spiromyces aspiralis]
MDTPSPASPSRACDPAGSINKRSVRKAYLFLAPDNTCLRVEDSSPPLLGYSTLHLINRPITSILHAADVGKFLSVCRSLDTSPNYVLNRQRRRSAAIALLPYMGIDELHSLPLSTLLRRCPGSLNAAEPLHILLPSGSFALLNTHCYWGGGMGAHLNDPSTHDRLYKVVQIEKFELGIFSAASDLVNRTPLTPPAFKNDPHYGH